MGQIRINIQAVLSQGVSIHDVGCAIGRARSSVEALGRQIDGKILNRRNLRTRVYSVSRQLGEIELRLEKICQVIDAGADSYYRTDWTAQRKAETLDEQGLSRNYSSLFL